MSETVTLPADTNQALGIARFAIDFLSANDDTRADPSPEVLARTELFHTDAALCGLSALALGTNAPNVLRNEALQYAVHADNDTAPGRCKHLGATVFASNTPVMPEKAILANCAAVREWDSNGTNFGFNPKRNHTAGEFGHNDFYPVCIAAAQLLHADGPRALRAMVCLDEIRGRLAEVFSLKTYKIDHVLHGALASAAVFGAMIGASPEQIESAIGMLVAHHVPFRAIRAGKQLSDSKGASAAITTEAAILSVKRSMAGFLGPRDIFRNPEAIYRLFEGPGRMLAPVDATNPTPAPPDPTTDASPFELVLSRAGSDFAVMGMHFKLGLYEHQSAGALQAMINILNQNLHLLTDPDGAQIKRIKILAYQPAFGIIGDPAKRNPTTRQSADHSMTYIVATLLRKALEQRRANWKDLMLEPADYSQAAINNPLTRTLMDKIEFEYGGDDYDRRYPDGIPTSVVITTADDDDIDSGLVMYPGGHARNDRGQTPVDLEDTLAHKFHLLASLASKDPDQLVQRYSNLRSRSADEIQSINDFDLTIADAFD